MISLVQLNHPPKQAKKALALFIIGICFFLTIDQWINFFYFKARPQPSVEKISPQKTKKLINKNSALFGSTLFGELQSEKNLIRQSSLDLEIEGILYSPDEKSSQVLIRPSHGKTQTYHVGESLPQGGKVVKIHQKNIIILYNGVLESLTLPENALSFLPPEQSLMGD